MENEKIASMDEVVREHLLRALDHYQWNKTHAALALRLNRRTVIRMIQRFKLVRPAPEVLLPACECVDAL